MPATLMRLPGRLRKRHTALTVGLVAVAVAGITATQILPSNAANPTAGSTYELVNAKSTMCVDVPGASTASGTKLQQWGCTDDTWQQFKLVDKGSGQYWLQNAKSSMCVDVPSGSTSTNVQLQQWGCSAGQANQLWTTKSSGDGHQLVNVGSGLCISTKDGSTASGAAIVQDTCTANNRMQWTLKTAGSSTPVTTTTTSSSSGSGSSTAMVNPDGSGRYKTVQAAIDAVGEGNKSRVTITVAPGTYREIVTIPKTKPYISLVGTGSAAKDTVIVNNHSAGEYGTSGSASVFVYGADFAASNLTFSNDLDESTVTSGAQAVALKVDADRAYFTNVRVLGDQDTLLINSGRSYFTGSYVEGTVDFIFGGGTAVFDASQIYEKRSTGGPITAAKTDASQTYGFLINKSTITGATNNTVQFGRPWGPDGQVVVRESTLSAGIKTAEPWTDMSGNTWENARFSEYRNTGAGATTNSNRPQLSSTEAANYTPAKYLAGSDSWNPISTPVITTTTAAASTSAAATTTSAGRTWSNTADGFASTDGGTTGGAAGQTVTVKTYDDLVKYATSSSAYVVKIAATIKVPTYGYEIPVTSNKTLIGVGTSGKILNGGITLKAGVSNVIIRNLTIGDTAMAEDDPDDKDYDYDGIQMDTANHVWIDHNTFTNINDGYIDSRKDTTNLTVSWNVLADHNKTFGIGWTDNVTSKITIHHNWIHDTNQRNPSVDNVAYAHLYNNYLANITSYGNNARGKTKMVVENSYFDNVKNPYYAGDSTASVSQSGSVVVNSSGKTQTTGTTFKPSDFYSYTLDKAADVPSLVKTYAGPQANIGS
ncbi:RICIN domain-containing protein [Kineosporia sp. J2-2]|uniref:RICIN domain-containing protein n=1 Tax=Kineosporia corallincola TaxID=2835133 RepID=A0ABS5TDC9_9ACTN|nr:pectinesterase family protein [Kineosporia corallincola]MBT0769095.1 RICIN domain-containing protein [Kineosporia corallincola]